MDRYGNYHYQQSGLWGSLRDGDFEESEVWDVMKERKDHQSHQSSLPMDHARQFASTNTHSAPKMVPKSSAGSGSSSDSGSAARSVFAGHQSAPVDIPNWSRVEKCMGRSKSSKPPETSRPWLAEYEDDEDAIEDEGQKLPPHEYIAMRLARSKNSSFSVLEGVGRKLKGRDLSNVRNDVLTRTGFLESP
ncbi:hypothetical protein SAY86_016306 [Trapa natans]|uniref:Senescence regulator n=1 Tax=Trapa natans TaxID=22666 RepID=A0AAN7LDE4_TRANT|nr:hypothetical protein SAY86_016306 [Trapa natans]